MILHKLTMNNFFRYYGVQEIDFSSDEKKNITVIKGENGRGKTTILAAFTWCFYGTLETRLKREKMFNDKAMVGLDEGETESVYVSISFSHDNKNYEIKRSQKFKKQNGQMFISGDESLDIKYKDEIGNTKEDIIDKRNFMNRIIPSKLKHFFFFDGENIDRLAQEEGEEEIKEAVLNILGLSVLDNLGIDLKEVDRNLIKELRQFKDEMGEDYPKKKEELIQRKGMLKDEIRNIEETKYEQESRLEEISRFLLAYSEENIYKLESKKLQLDNEVYNLKKDANNVNEQINKFISTKAKHVLINPYLNDVRQLLEDKRQKGKLPSNIKSTFIDEIIDRGICICGNEIIIDSSELKILQELKENAGREELDDAYFKTINYINFIESMAERLQDEYIEFIMREKRLMDEIEIREINIDNIDSELKDNNKEEVSLKAIERDAIKKQIEQNIRDMTYKTSELENINKKIEDIEEKINKVNFQSNEAKMIQKQINKTKELIELNDNVHNTFKNEVRVDLDRRIKEVFKSISHKEYRVPILTDDFKLKVVNDFNEKEREVILSTGESQVSSLSFIGALVSYSRDKQYSKLYSSFMGGDFPIVMDSPFGQLDEEHSSQIAKGIGELATQVVIIVSNRQWKKDVEENVYSRLGKMYELREGGIENSKEGEFTYVEEVSLN